MTKPQQTLPQKKKNLEAIPLKLRRRQDNSLCSRFNIVLETMVGALRQKKELKGK